MALSLTSFRYLFKYHFVKEAFFSQYNRPRKLSSEFDFMEIYIKKNHTVFESAERPQLFRENPK